MRIALTILTIASSILSTHAQLVISACCGDVGHCKNYTSIDELIGVSCCGHQPINRFTQICCQNTVRERRHGPVYYDACCGNETVTNKQTCCGNVVSCRFHVYVVQKPLIKVTRKHHHL
ncbi:hypothetical protein Tcan_09315 [Toxocara canis]|uniref:Uncharacterized protein n=1 Tax=Toxocara canis TaxID=6265 RepID=A0A0B2VD30_TOXCA|nr:hypothetical protein Tcan_09315 [Toxocara canis]